ncbi:MAG TPA: translation initiation factor 2 [Enterovirga sp.]|jgi:hypothetical protein
MGVIVAALVALNVGACASVTRGTTENMTFISEPSGATVTTSVGYTCPATPCTTEIKRSAEFDAIFSKPGYREQIVPVRTKLSGSGTAGFAGNVLLGGVVGMAVDAGTGAAMDHVPNPVMATLVPDALPSTQRARAKARRKVAAPQS